MHKCFISLLLLFFFPFVTFLAVCFGAKMKRKGKNQHENPSSFFYFSFYSKHISLLLLLFFFSCFITRQTTMHIFVACPRTCDCRELERRRRWWRKVRTMLFIVLMCFFPAVLMYVFILESRTDYASRMRNNQTERMKIANSAVFCVSQAAVEER